MPDTPQAAKYAVRAEAIRPADGDATSSVETAAKLSKHVDGVGDLGY
jgi:hypothetical protein